MLKKDDFEIHNNFFFPSVAHYKGYYYKIKEIVGITYPTTNDPNILMQTHTYLTNKEGKYYRYSYTFLDLLAEMGGFAKSITASLAALLSPVIMFMFYASSIQTVYLKSETTSCNNCDDTKEHIKCKVGNSKFFDNDKYMSPNLK